MTERQAEARRELTVLATVVVALSRLVDGPAAWLVAALLIALTAAGTRRVLLAGVQREPQLASLVTPAVAAVACLGALRLIPIGLVLIPTLVAAWALIDASVAIEVRIAARAQGPTDSDRGLLRALCLFVAFLAFTGVAVLVPGGLAEPAGAGAGVPPLSEGALLVLAASDAAVAFLLGFRLSALRAGRRRDALLGAAGYALAIAIAAGLVRAAALPRLLGPAILTLVFFLWDAFRGTEPAARRDPRFIWQVALLGVLGIIVVGWNLMLRA
jgi:hypothetical protein